MARKAKFRVGEKVFTYQSQTEKAAIIECVDRGISDDTDWGFHYRLTLPSGDKSNWTSERSMDKKMRESWV